MSFQLRDFIETTEGLVFAVVDGAVEDGKVLCFLRYGPYGKLNTAAANALLRASYPCYLHHSARMDAVIHAVPVERIHRHHQPRERLLEILAHPTQDAIEGKLLRLLKLLMDGGLALDSFGVTGSLLLGCQTLDSDIDMVIYGRDNFFRALARVRELVKAGLLDELDAVAWRDTYERRGCELSFEEYLWHEGRKGNKGVIEGTKFDLALNVETSEDEPQSAWFKTGPALISGRVLDDARTFDYPARYPIDHPEIAEVLSFSHTYVGQAKTGETIEVAGNVETSGKGRKRIVVGSSREALGEFIRVLQRFQHQRVT